MRTTILIIMALMLVWPASGNSFNRMRRAVARMHARQEQNRVGHLRETVSYLTSIGRGFPDTESLDKAAAWLTKRLERYGWTVLEQPYEVEGRVVRNLLAYYGDPVQPLTIIGAHYDTALTTPGADDNASGVAVLLEIARLMTLDGAKPPSDLCLAFYTLEEPQRRVGFQNMGSWRHAFALAEGKTEVEQMISLEMVGYFSEKPGSQQYPDPSLADQYPDRGNFLAVLADAASLEDAQEVAEWLDGATTFPIFAAPVPPGFDDWAFSDHYPFWVAGFRAMVITDTAWLRNPNYHQASDLPKTLNYDRMSELARALAELFAVTVRPE